MKSFSESYRSAGVDITAGYKSVELMKSHIARTNVPGVVSGIGGFGGLFAPDLTGMKEPVLVSGTDGVLKIPDNSCGFCDACFTGNYPCHPPKNPGKSKFEKKISEGKEQ